MSTRQAIGDRHRRGVRVLMSAGLGIDEESNPALWVLAPVAAETAPSLLTMFANQPSVFFTKNVFLHRVGPTANARRRFG